MLSFHSTKDRKCRVPDSAVNEATEEMGTLWQLAFDFENTAYEICDYVKSQVECMKF